MRRAQRHLAELGLAAVVIATVAMMIVPLPTPLLDVLIAGNLSLALLLLLTALFVERPLSFGAFPTLLLIGTLYRLGLNVSSTRLILTQADAGEVIASFGAFVVGGDYLVGGVIFALLALIQFVVIARGSERVAEVGARFTLDAMPGKQLAIDADLRAGVIDAATAMKRRHSLEREGQFYGAMDGAMRFVRGDAIAAVAIIGVNLVGGIGVGVLSRDMELGEALRVYGLLTVGDGLVSQMPALLISTAAGLVVTRVASEDGVGSLGRDVFIQVFGDARALGGASLFCFVLSFVPGLPLAPFALLGTALGCAAWWRHRARPAPPVVLRPPGAPRANPLELMTGAKLATRLVRDPSLAEHLSEAGERLYDELGVRIARLVPIPSSRLAPDEYELRLGGIAAQRGRCPEGHRWIRGEAEALLIEHPEVTLEGEGGWVTTSAGGLDAPERIAQHVTTAARRNPARLIGLEETRRELDRLAREAPTLVRSVVPARLPLPKLTRLLQDLVREGVSVKGLREILEALSIDPLPSTPGDLAETVRERLSGPITETYTDAAGVLRALALDPVVEEALRDARTPEGEVALRPELTRDLVDAVRAARGNVRAVVLTQPDVRRALRATLEHDLPDVPVLSYRELDPRVQIERVGVVTP